MNQSLIPALELPDIKLPSECGNDEESNNGPLDFSLHRGGVGLPLCLPDLDMKTPAACSKRRSYNNKPRVKLTLRETSEQRERRLLKGRERMRRLRANESFEERQIRLLKARECQERRRRKEREIESPGERERRLLVARERTRERRKVETQQQREKRLKATRERLRWKRMSETPEERQKRLSNQKDKKRQKYHYLASDDREVYKSRKPKIDVDVERRKTRGISFKYDIIDDELDEALWHFQSTDQPGTNSPDEIRWLAEPEVCLSVDSAHTFSPDKSTETDQTQQQKTESLPPPHQIQEQISEHVSNLVMNTIESVADISGNGAETSSEHPSGNSSDIQSELQNDFKTNCCTHISSHSVPNSERTERQQQRGLCNNSHNSEIVKIEPYSTQTPGPGPGPSPVPSLQQQYSVVTRMDEPRLQYEQNLSTYESIVSSSSDLSQIHSCGAPPHHQNLCNQVVVSSTLCNHSHVNANPSLYSHAVMHSHTDTPLNLHNPNFLYPRYPVPYPNLPKHNASMYLDYPSYNLPSHCMEGLSNKKLHLPE